MSLIDSTTNWVRHNSFWSGSSASRWERVLSLTVILTATGLIYLSTVYLALWQSALFWSVFLLAVAVCTQQGWLKLFGPVLFYDMVRTARLSRYSIMRMLYAGLLFSILSFMMFLHYVSGPQQRTPRETAMLAEIFFSVFMVVQLVMVVLLTPAYVAGAIAEEKDRKTLEFLLATDLHNREIVLSKLLSRLGNMTLLLMTGIPFLSILQFIGGVDPDLMLAGFAGIGLTLLGLSGVSILFSTLFQKPRDAISLTYLILVAYVSLASVALILRDGRHPLMALPLWFGEDPPTMGLVSDVLNAGNPITAIIDIGEAIGGRTRAGGRTSLGAELPGILRRYASFHLLLALVCVVWSIARVRAIALKQTGAGTTARLRWWQRLRPPVGSFPMLWKECYIEGSVKYNWLVWLAVLVLVLLTLGSGVWITVASLLDVLAQQNQNFWHMQLRGSMNIWFRTAGTGVSSLLLLMTAVRASTSITNERERDTLDALIATPLSSESILFAKLVGNLISLRIGWVWYGSMLLLAVCTGGVHPIGVPLLLVAWFVYAVGFTMVGLFFSMVCKSSLQSAVCTVMASLVLAGAHWIVTSCCCAPVYSLMLGFGLRQIQLQEFFLKLGEYFIKFEAGITPPFVLGLFAFSWDELDLQRNWQGVANRWYLEFIASGLVGLAIWAAASALVWFVILTPMCRKLTRRVEYLSC